MSTTELVRPDGEVVTQSTGISVQNVIDRLELIQDLMKRAMIKDVDYGIIPGTNNKPTLLKPGAEKLCVMFRLAPRYKTTKIWHPDGHLTVETTCQILDSGENFLGEASAMCSTREAKYAYRRAERVCPDCQKAAIIKGSAQYGGGWLCWKKKDGCGMKFADDDQRITSQQVGRVANPDIADSYNTVLRIAEKRALLGAVRLVTGSSALFDEEIPSQTERDDDRQPAQNNKPAPPPEDPEVTKTREYWESLMSVDPPPLLEDVNTKALPEIRAMPKGAPRNWAWGVVKISMEGRGYVYDETTKGFVEPMKREDGHGDIPF